MRKNLFTRPVLEVLEDRWVPATIKFNNGVLQITGQDNHLTITQTANNQFKIKEGGGAAITYKGVSSIYATTPDGNHSVTVNLGKFDYTGSLTVKTGNGNGTVDIEGAGGDIRGNVLITSGNGNQTLTVGTETGALTLFGNLTVVDSFGLNIANFGGTVANGHTLTIKGDVNLTAVDDITLDSFNNDKFLGNFTAGLGNNNHGTTLEQAGTLDFQQGVFAGTTLTGAGTITIGKNLTLTGGSGEDLVATIGMKIGGNLNVNLGSNGDTTITQQGDTMELSETVAGAGITTVGGSTNYTGTAGFQFLDLADTVFNGNVTLNLGTGNSVLGLDDPHPSTPTVINGNLTVYSQGNLQTSAPGGTPIGNIEATINGNAAFYLGDGNSSISFDPGPNSTTNSGVTGTVIVHAGNGGNNLSFLNPSTVQSTIPGYKIDVKYGNGDNSVTLNDPNADLTGSLIGGTGKNTFTVIAGTNDLTTIQGFN